MNTNATGDNIKALLEERGMSQRELAEMIGVTNVTMSRWINGQRQPTAYALLRISRVFGKSVEELMEGVDSEGRRTTMIRVNDKWVIDVDENANYMPKIDRKKTEPVKQKDGTTVERPVYGPPIGYYRNLEAALKGIIAKEFQTMVAAEDITLADAVKALGTIRDNITPHCLHLEEV